VKRWAWKCNWIQLTGKYPENPSVGSPIVVLLGLKLDAKCFRLLIHSTLRPSEKDSTTQRAQTLHSRSSSNLINTFHAEGDHEELFMASAHFFPAPCKVSTFAGHKFGVCQDSVLWHRKDFFIWTHQGEPSRPPSYSIMFKAEKLRPIIQFSLSELLIISALLRYFGARTAKSY
jgi:hypothetical protein